MSLRVAACGAPTPFSPLQTEEGGGLTFLRGTAGGRGRTLCHTWNTDILRGTGIMILLEADLTVLTPRVRLADRPRVNPKVSLEEDL
jgi:hypothetical protein